MCVGNENVCVPMLVLQVVGAGVQSAQLTSDRDRAVAALDEATRAATAAQQDAARLRRALLDAEIDTQRSTVAADSAGKKLRELEAELTQTK